MYRWEVSGLDSLRRNVTVWVAATTKEEAMDVAFDDMGLWTITSVKKSSSRKLPIDKRRYGW